MVNRMPRARCSPEAYRAAAEWLVRVGRRCTFGGLVGDGAAIALFFANGSEFSRASAVIVLLMSSLFLAFGIKVLRKKRPSLPREPRNLDEISEAIAGRLKQGVVLPEIHRARMGLLVSKRR